MTVTLQMQHATPFAWSVPLPAISKQAARVTMLTAGPCSSMPHTCVCASTLNVVDCRLPVLRSPRNTAQDSGLAVTTQTLTALEPRRLQVLKQPRNVRRGVTVSQDTIICLKSGQHSAPDISQLSPQLQRQWHHAKNAHLGKVQITPHNGRRVWWTCDQCPDGHTHEWLTRVADRTGGSGCPFCASRKVCQHSSLATKAPAIAAQFSSKDCGAAHDYMVTSSKKIIWQCEHGHEWVAAIRTRTNLQAGCPVCHDIRRRLEPQARHPVLTNSQHPMMKFWDWELNAQAGLNPSKIRCRSNRKAHWICPCCPKGQPHRWQADIHNVYAGRGCPCCFGRKACVCNSLEALFPDVAAEWDYTKNEGTPGDYTASSNASVWWCNSKRGSFWARIASQTHAYKRSTQAS